MMCKPSSTSASVITSGIKVRMTLPLSGPVAQIVAFDLVEHSQGGAASQRVAAAGAANHRMIHAGTNLLQLCKELAWRHDKATFAEDRFDDHCGN